MSHIDENSIFSSIAGGSFVVLLAKLYLGRILRDIETSITSAKSIERELLTLKIKVETLEKNIKDHR